MDDIQLIVSKLNQPPFNEKMRLVEFDEKTPMELLETIVTVLKKIEPNLQIDLRSANIDTTLYDNGSNFSGISDTNNTSTANGGMAIPTFITQMMQFLAVLKCTFPKEIEPTDIEVNFVKGNKTLIYHVLTFLLTKYDSLVTRAYLARYLMPVDIPIEYMQDDTLCDLVQRLKEMQGDFKSIHKNVSALRKSDIRPSELKNDISHLEDEKRQLEEKISKLRKSIEFDDNEKEFNTMLTLTSSYRTEQEEEMTILDRIKEQMESLSEVEEKVSSTTQKLKNLKNSINSSRGPQAILEELTHENRQLEVIVNETLPKKIMEGSNKVKKLEKAKNMPQRSADDVADMERMYNKLSHENKQISDRVDAVYDDISSNAGDERLLLYKNQAAVATSKRFAKEEELDKLRNEKEILGGEIEEKEHLLNSIAGPKFMSKEEFKAYGVKLREKTIIFKKYKNELADLRSESVVLHRTKELLEGKAKNLENFLSDLETKKGIHGYRETQDKLVKASERTSEIDVQKGSTLEEISEIVNTIQKELKERKVKLTPVMEKLKQARKKCQEVENNYYIAKSNYEKVAVGLELERTDLEASCNKLQEECLAEESRYYCLQSLISIQDGHLEKIRNEESYMQGEGRLLNSVGIKCYKDLYLEKVTQQENLSKQLRRQLRNLREEEPKNLQQKKLYTELKDLLELKLQIKKKSSDPSAMIGTESSSKEFVNMNRNCDFDKNSVSEGYNSRIIDYGSSNVMTFGNQGDSKYD